MTDNVKAPPGCKAPTDKLSRALTAPRLRELLSYDPHTGVFTWLIKPNPRIKVGAVAGYLGDDGYIRIKLDGHTYKAHRLAWLHVTGEWPTEQIDHKLKGFENRRDNRFANLRPATNKQNMENQGIGKANRSGVLGVNWHRRDMVWRAFIGHLWRRLHLGNFKTKEEAIAARRKAELTLFTHAP